ncbi:hypothetical protein [Humisphaera borealis]|uniref:DUF3352 domain-containing protein n=1 Tax=Humisphaera borealis TaxID=2807512 RepID=A0A7M2WQI6_9BACT|nr:hypothetical protein [Humisphaera borealis]QOV87716.1 hypothetical protein IPV69_15640 [Humisphaera borealis]
MTRRFLPFLIVFVVAFAALVAPAAAAKDAKPTLPPPLPGAANFIDDKTMIVGYVDVPAVEPEALLNWVVTMLKAGQSPQEEIDGATYALRGLVPPAKKWVGDFGRAGGKALFVVVSSDALVPPVVVVPVDRRANGNALAELLKSPFGVPLPSGFIPTPGKPGPGIPYGYHVDRIGDALALGNPQTLRKANELSRQPGRPARPELTAALADSGGTVRVAFAMTEPLRTILRSIGPNLPAELGGEPTATLTEKMSWATLSFDAPAGRSTDASLRLSMQAVDSDAARRLKNIAVAVFRTTVNDGDLGKHPDKDKVLTMLEPQVQGDRVEVRLDPAEMKASAGILGPLAIKAREKAARDESETKLKLLVSAIRNYTGDTGGRFPRSMEDPELLKYLGKTPAEHKVALLNPVNPGRGYVMLSPSVPAGVNPSAVLLVYEGYDKWPSTGIQGGFADGRVAVIKTEPELKAMVRAATGR